MNGVTMNMDSKSIRFTPDGRVSVVDAIHAVCGPRCPNSIWESIKEKNPEILLHCGEYSFQGKSSDTVMSSKGMEKLWFLLLDYL